MDSKEVKKLREQIRSSTLVNALLSEKAVDGRIHAPPYRKWNGAHWVLLALAEIGYPPGDRSLVPLCDQASDMVLASRTIHRFKVIQGRVRWHASIEGNFLYAVLSLGLADERAEQVASNLLEWQWPDGGWNCDLNPQTTNSSFHETLAPLRGLAAYGSRTGSPEVRKAVRRASEVFLKRKLFRRQRDGGIMDRRFLRLHYPCYYHYDILFGLKVMAEAGFIDDQRCREALKILESKRLPDGGFPSEEAYYHTGGKRATRRSTVNWGGVSKRRLNEFITTDALYVLRAAAKDLSNRNRTFPTDPGAAAGP